MRILRPLAALSHVGEKELHLSVLIHTTAYCTPYKSVKTAGDYRTAVACIDSFYKGVHLRATLRGRRGGLCTDEGESNLPI